jgi:hypothetical protein
MGGRVAAMAPPWQSDGASVGSRVTTSFSTAHPCGQTSTRFQAHGHPAQLARPVVTSTAPPTQRASPVGQSCFTAIAEANVPGSSRPPGAQLRPQPLAAIAAIVDKTPRRGHKQGNDMSERIRTFEEFWPFYVREHSKKTTRRLHFVGTTAAVALVGYAALRRKVWPLLVAPIAGYGPAWISHFFIEGNKPATFKYPLWSLRADFVMWSKMVGGTMDAEVERVLRESEDRTTEQPTERTATPAS